MQEAESRLREIENRHTTTLQEERAILKQAAQDQDISRKQQLLREAFDAGLLSEDEFHSKSAGLR